MRPDTSPKTANGHRVVEVTQRNRRVRRQRGGKTDAIDEEAAAGTFLAEYGTATVEDRERTRRVARRSPALQGVPLSRPHRLHQRTQNCAAHRTTVATRPVPRSHYPGADQEMRRSPRRRQRGRGRHEADPAVVGAPLPAPQCRSPRARADPDRAHPAGATPTSWPLSVSDPTPPHRCSSLPVTTPNASPPKPGSPRSAAPTRSRRAPGRPTGCDWNRAGDRQPNTALHRIVVVRLGRDPETRAYMAAHLNANGSNKMHVMPILKRYVVRRLYPADQPGSAKP